MTYQPNEQDNYVSHCSSSYELAPSFNTWCASKATVASSPLPSARDTTSAIIFLDGAGIFFWCKDDISLRVKWYTGQYSVVLKLHPSEKATFLTVLHAWIQCLKYVPTLFACWFQPAQTSQSTVFFSHNKLAPASPNQLRNQPANRFSSTYLLCKTVEERNYFFIKRVKSSKHGFSGFSSLLGESICKEALANRS